MTRLPTPPRSIRPPNDRLVGGGGRGLVVLGWVTLLFFGALGGRLGFLQLVQGARNRQLANDNRIRLLPKRPERGKIFDRRGRALATSQFTYSVFVWPLVTQRPEWPQTLELLANILVIPAAQIQAQLDQFNQGSPTLVRVAKNLSFAQVVALSERSSELVGVELDKEAVRFYPQGELAAQVLGHIGEINAQELANRREQGYRIGDVIGKMGIEAQYETQLQGRWGGQQVEVDSAGHIVNILGQKPPQPGKSVTLTLDLDLQAAAEKALGARPGAVVALDPRDGAVLAMVSYPRFEPNWFARGVSATQWQALQTRQYPLVNRATQAFPPASTYKVLTAIAGLETNKFSPQTYLATAAAVHGVGESNGSGFGTIGFRQALQWSSNTFFGQVGVKVGPQHLFNWARKLGLGTKTGIDLPAEAPGFLPTPAWKQKNFQDQWYPADSVMVAIGQGAVQVSPLQVAVLFAAIANNGHKVTPHLLHTNRPPEQWRQPLHLSASTLAVIRQGLRDVVTRGTGKALNVPNLPPIAGKSGTGEDPPRPSHTWFAGYAPEHNPEIVVVAFGQNTGGGGGSVCGPIVRDVLAAYFKHNPH